MLVLLLSTTSFSISAQRVLKKSLVNRHGRFFHIDVNDAYQLKLSTTKGQEISVEARVEGEYERDIVLNFWEEGSHVFIDTEFHPEFHLQTDKLSAHKVLSVSITVSLPEQMTVFVKGDSSRVLVEGYFQELQVELFRGACELSEVYGTVDVVTQSGDITLNCKEGAVNVHSEYGKVVSDKIPLGNAVYNLNSSTGDIRVIRTE